MNLSLLNRRPLKLKCLLQALPLLIFVRNDQGHAVLQWPLHPDIRIIPRHAAFIARMIEVCTFIYKLGLITEHQLSVGKARRYINLLFIFRGQLHSEPLSICG